MELAISRTDIILGILTSFAVFVFLTETYIFEFVIKTGGIVILGILFTLISKSLDNKSIELPHITIDMKYYVGVIGKVAGIISVFVVAAIFLISGVTFWWFPFLTPQLVIVGFLFLMLGSIFVTVAVAFVGSALFHKEKLRPEA